MRQSTICHQFSKVGYISRFAVSEISGMKVWALTSSAEQQPLTQSTASKPCFCVGSFQQNDGRNSVAARGFVLIDHENSRGYPAVSSHIVFVGIMSQPADLGSPATVSRAVSADFVSSNKAKTALPDPDITAQEAPASYSKSTMSLSAAQIPRRAPEDHL